ncbi:unnamed protein product, partial [Prunus brigantina]
LKQLLPLAWSHNPLTTLKLIFNVDSIRFCDTNFDTTLLWLHQNHPKTSFNTFLGSTTTEDDRVISVAVFLGAVHESPHVLIGVDAFPGSATDIVRHSDGLGIMADEVGVFA